ncbi:prepilin-type N-terminal cleavage/methylation domain-containing protein [uncultured Ferrimonas sp.]|uniref:PulJ/GspJ family protein n=1 Tax=uncultured Ferrimonas sp. TaxID=432640 RepID=UPI00260B0D3B|nr:prepilin-type N-terminal cleavage/methylation domain-containing protein [uncultured Ferrimonas sp.]
MRNRGFTLIELVVTVVVISVLALGVTSFINYGARIYQSSSDWQQQMSQLRLASQRFSREVSQAVPGTVSVGSSCISFRPLASAERFFANPQIGTTDTILAYTPSCCSGSDCSPCNGLTAVLLNGYQPHFYDLQSTTVSSCGGSCSQAQLQFSQAIDPATYASSGRFFFAEEAVQWCVVGEQIQRNGVLMGEGLTNNLTDCINNGANDSQCPFVMAPPSLGRNNLVRLQWWFSVDNQQQRWAQEVQLANVP